MNKFFLKRLRRIFKSLGKYEYKIHWFDKITQNGILIGKWKEWNDNYTKMFYENGAYCRNGKQDERKAELNLICGSPKQIIEISEPELCTYSIKVQLPHVCKKEQLEGLNIDKKLI